MLFRFIVEKLCVVRVDPNGRVYMIETLRYRDRSAKVVRTRIASSHVQHRDQACIVSSLNDFFPVDVELFPVDVTMGIHEPHYFKRAPTLTSSRNVAIAGVSSSVNEAAQIIPCDSSPLIFRGFRLATTTTFRPISLSGS